jgi:hypothetical protein
MVTMPRANESVSVVNAQGQAGKVTVCLGSHRCSWELKDLPETDYLLVYGADRAAKVKVGGKVVRQATSVARNATPAGWETDAAGNRLIIRLPSGKLLHSLPTRTIEVEL